MDMATSKIDLTALEAPSAVAAIRRIADGFKAFQALRAGLDSGLFDWLELNGPAEKSAIATAVKLRGAHLGGFLQTLEDLGLLTRQDGRYMVNPDMRTALVSNSPWCQASVLANLLDPSNGWSDLRSFMSEGWQMQPAQAASTVSQHPYLGEARRLAAALAARWRQGGDSPRHLLCFDGADGLAAAAICQSVPGLTAAVVVAPDAVGRAEMLIEACGLAKRCIVYAGNPLTSTVRASYDHVVIFHALYAVRKSLKDALAAAVARLSPGGELCLAHWFCLEACESAPGGLRDLDKAVLTDSHPLCHVEQFCQRLEEVGVGETARADLVGEYGNTKLHFGRRPMNG